MTEHFFGLHDGHLDRDLIRDVLRQHGMDSAVHHTNYTEPNDDRRGWFCCPGVGEPFDGLIAARTMAAIEVEGGLDAFRVRRGL